ncbi:MAG: hypothetical protein H6577_18070 [Lewinellaceae bacterium]|nr:hypothetical protein [Saprospiraceae bacterium]MCB9340033.1 hypothetical protein [Lewinellaceae bacterium]
MKPIPCSNLKTSAAFEHFDTTGKAVGGSFKKQGKYLGPELLWVGNKIKMQLTWQWVGFLKNRGRSVFCEKQRGDTTPPCNEVVGGIHNFHDGHRPFF